MLQIYKNKSDCQIIAATEPTAARMATAIAIFPNDNSGYWMRNDFRDIET